MHPTWQGARLHALDIVIRMARQGLIHIDKPERLLQQYLAMEPAVSDAYVEALGGDFPPLTVPSFRRFELGQPSNARGLLRRLNELEGQRLASFPLPDASQATFPGFGKKGGLVWSTYREPNGREEMLIKTPQGREVAWLITPHQGRQGYQRVDVLGNGTFLPITPWSGNFQLPSWVISAEPEARWGI